MNSALLSETGLRRFARQAAEGQLRKLKASEYDCPGAARDIIYAMASISYHLRAANAGDAAAIRSLIRQAHINPTGLSWRRFVVAVDSHGALLGTGQVKPHGDGSLELASIAVQPGWRGHGVARAIIERLLAEYPGPLYLTCRAKLGPFYEKFGFERLEESDMPAYFRTVSRAFNMLQHISGKNTALWVMRRTPA